MIGVLAKDEEGTVVREFFELFKTPWEFVRPEGTYHVLLVTSDEIPDSFSADLVLVYSARERRCDRDLAGRPAGGSIVVGTSEGSIPLYGSARLFEGRRDRTAPRGEGEIKAETRVGEAKLIRVGYDLFSEVRFLLEVGQPRDKAASPTLDLHINFLRRNILEGGIPILEVPPVPHGKQFISCLTHDIDFVYLRQHFCDHSMWGFLFRATFGSLRDCVSGRKTFRQLLRNWLAAFQLPFVYAGILPDFWQQFGGYLKVEDGKPSTFFIIPQKNKAGKPGRNGSAPKRATKYDISDIPEWVEKLQKAGCEIALHGLDAWADKKSAIEESSRIRSFTKTDTTGVRMHWLYFSENSPGILNEAEFAYDSTCGYNDAIGFRAGTNQVFKPLSVSTLLELPLHIQDTALFYPGRLHLRPEDAWNRCMEVVEHATHSGGVVTVLWHDRSLAPERLWGDFYAALLAQLDAKETWFGTARQVTDWFRNRRSVRFEEIRFRPGRAEVRLAHSLAPGSPEMCVRLSKIDSDGKVQKVDLPVGRSRSSTLTFPFNETRSRLSDKFFSNLDCRPTDPSRWVEQVQEV